MGSDGGVITISQFQADTNSDGQGGLPCDRGTLPTAGRTTPTLPTPRAQRHVSLSLLDSSTPIDIEKHVLHS